MMARATGTCRFSVLHLPQRSLCRLVQAVQRARHVCLMLLHRLLCPVRVFRLCLMLDRLHRLFLDLLLRLLQRLLLRLLLRLLQRLLLRLLQRLLLQLLLRLH